MRELIDRLALCKELIQYKIGWQTDFAIHVFALFLCQPKYLWD